MALDSSLVGVIGASAALFVIFCILAVIIGCFCLRRAKKRRQQQLVDKILQKQKEERQEHSHHSSETLNKPPSLAARSNGGGSMARSEGLPHKMADYRPKILEESMISHGYRSDTRPAMEQTSANRGGNTISTIFVNENKHSDDADNNNLDYNQNNGFIVKGYLHNSHRLNQSPQNGAVPQGYVPYVYPVPYYEDMRPARQGEPPKERQVFKQKVEMGPDGRLVVARSHQEHGYWTGNMSTEPRKIIDEAGSTKGEADRVLPSTTSEQTRVVSFSQESDEEQSQKISQTVTEDLKAEPDDRRPSPPAMANEEEGKDGVEDQVEHATGMKTPNLDNYKVIKREHSSTYLKMPEWVVSAEMVGQISPLDSTDNDVFAVGQPAPRDNIKDSEQAQQHHGQQDYTRRQTDTGASAVPVNVDSIYRRVAYYPGNVVAEGAGQADYPQFPTSAFSQGNATTVNSAAHIPNSTNTGDFVAGTDGFAQMDFDAEDKEVVEEKAGVHRGDNSQLMQPSNPIFV